MDRRFRKRTGFTLVEVLIAITLVGMAITPITTLLSLGLRWSAEASYRVRALYLAVEVLDKLLSRNDGPPQLPEGSAVKRDDLLCRFEMKPHTEREALNEVKISLYCLRDDKEHRLYTFTTLMYTGN